MTWVHVLKIALAQNKDVLLIHVIEALAEDKRRRERLSFEELDEKMLCLFTQAIQAGQENS